MSATGGKPEMVAEASNFRFDWRSGHCAPKDISFDQPDTVLIF
jgi:hypothetical protein